MKKIKTSLLAIALAIGVVGAFAFNAPSNNKIDDPIYDWTDSENNQFQGTVSEASSYFDCSDGMNICAQGTLVPGETGPQNGVLVKP
ncbi:MAG: hypothetical protein JST58_09580 [Bacteroidetes bacterium]|nr:hypothetical protein [Bacteroidota bacterium]